MYQLIYTGMEKKQGVFRFFSEKGLLTGFRPRVSPDETCTANLYRLGKIAFRPEKVMIRAGFPIEACMETWYIGFHDRIPLDVNTPAVLSLA